MNKDTLINLANNVIEDKTTVEDVVEVLTKGDKELTLSLVGLAVESLKEQNQENYNETAALYKAYTEARDRRDKFYTGITALREAAIAIIGDDRTQRRYGTTDYSWSARDAVEVTSVELLPPQCVKLVPKLTEIKHAILMAKKSRTKFKGARLVTNWTLNMKQIKPAK